MAVVRDAGDVRDRFTPPPIRLFFNRRLAGRPEAGQGYFCLPAELAGDCSPALPARPPAAERDEFADVAPFSELLRDASEPS